MLGNKLFCKMHLRAGYWQVNLRSGDKEKTAFITEDGLYQFKRMPFGLTNAPGTFQRLVDHILAPFEDGHGYIDDVLLGKKTAIQLFWALLDLSMRFYRAGLRWMPDKCLIGMKVIEALGHIISEADIYPDPERIAAVQKIGQPGTLTQVRSFLGLTGYYRRFVQDYAKVAAPLFQLLKKENHGPKGQITWNEDCQKAFDALKQLLTSAPILAYPRYGDPFELHTDASGVGIGAILHQKDDEGHLRPCAYASRVLRGSELNYGSTERELLAVVWGLYHYRVYLMSSPVTVVTDHAALEYVRNMRSSLVDFSGKFARWALFIQGFTEVQLKYRPGQKHQNADALSRLPQPLPLDEPDLDEVLAMSTDWQQAFRPIFEDEEWTNEYVLNPPPHWHPDNYVQVEGRRLRQRSHSICMMTRRQARRLQEEAQQGTAPSDTDPTATGASNDTPVKTIVEPITPPNLPTAEMAHIDPTINYQPRAPPTTPVPPQNDLQPTAGTAVPTAGIAGTEEPEAQMPETIPKAPDDGHRINPDAIPEDELQLPNPRRGAERDRVIALPPGAEINPEDRYPNLQIPLPLPLPEHLTASAAKQTDRSRTRYKVLPRFSQQLRDAVRRDPYAQAMIDYLRGGPMPNEFVSPLEAIHMKELLYEEDGLLWKVDGPKKDRKGRPKRTDEETPNIGDRLYVPPPLREPLIREVHGGRFGGHYAIENTRATLARHYFWPGMYHDVRQFYYNCHLCMQHKRGQIPPAELEPIEINWPWSVVSVDAVGPIAVPSPEGNIYILVFVDHFTKYCECVPVKELTAEVFADAFVYNVVARHGCPEILHSDRGTNFAAELSEEVCKLFGVHKTFGTAYHPATQGQVERMNSIIM